MSWDRASLPLGSLFVKATAGRVGVCATRAQPYLRGGTVAQETRIQHRGNFEKCLSRLSSFASHASLSGGSLTTGGV
ncbi:hypothetical protein D3C81_1813440 [compost metagenome]